MRSVGRIYTPGSIGYDLRYAEERKLPDGGREIILATDRPMSFWEIVNRPRSAEYPFTWVQFTMRPDGTGEGKLAVAARIIGEEADDLIEVEDFAIPVAAEHRSLKGATSMIEAITSRREEGEAQFSPAGFLSAAQASQKLAISPTR